MTQFGFCDCSARGGNGFGAPRLLLGLWRVLAAQGRLFPMDPVTLLGYNKAKSAQKELGMHGNHGRAFLSVPPPPLISAREGQPCPKHSSGVRQPKRRGLSLLRGSWASQAPFCPLILGWIKRRMHQSSTEIPIRTGSFAPGTGFGAGLLQTSGFMGR